MKNITAMCSEMHHNDKPKWNVIIAKLPYVMWTYHIKRIATSLELSYCNKRISNVIGT